MIKSSTKIQLSLRLIAGLISLTSTNAFATSNSLLFFTTQQAYWGNLGGIPGADDKCQADIQCPSGSICRAIIAAPDIRYACADTNKCGGDNSLDWVVLPNQSYVDTKGQLVGTTSANALLNFPEKTWTGMMENGTASPDNCTNWSIGSGKKAHYLFGLLNATTRIGACSRYDAWTGIGNKVCVTHKYGGDWANVDGCSARHLACVQQASGNCSSQAAPNAYWFNCDKSNASLANSNLTAANLVKTNLNHADLSYANLTHADLAHANLTAANLTGANLTGAKFVDANLRGATWTDGKTICNATLGSCQAENGNTIIAIKPSTDKLYLNLKQPAQVSYTITNDESIIKLNSVTVNKTAYTSTIIRNDCTEAFTHDLNSCTIIVQVYAKYYTGSLNAAKLKLSLQITDKRNKLRTFSNSQVLVINP